jgi:hypothetical protein
MLNARLSAARRIAAALNPSESDIERAIASTSQLIAAIAEARADTSLPISIGQEALAALSSTTTALVRARAAIAAAHAALAEDRVNAGLKAYDMGDVSNCPPLAGLSLVEDQRSAA